MKSKAGADRHRLQRGKRMKHYLHIVPALLLAGCASVGSNYDPNAVSQLHAGMAKEEVVRLLGKPNTVTTMPNGQTALGWVHSTASPFSASARSVSLIFDADGKLSQTYQNQTDVK